MKCNVFASNKNLFNHLLGMSHFYFVFYFFVVLHVFYFDWYFSRSRLPCMIAASEVPHSLQNIHFGGLNVILFGFVWMKRTSAPFHIINNTRQHWTSLVRIISKYSSRWRKKHANFSEWIYCMCEPCEHFNNLCACRTILPKHTIRFCYVFPIFSSSLFRYSYSLFVVR